MRILETSASLNAKMKEWNCQMTLLKFTWEMRGTRQHFSEGKG